MKLSHITVVVCAFALGPMTDAIAGSPAESSYRLARETLEAAYEHQGAADWFERPVPVLITAEGTLFQGTEHQGRRPDDPTPAPFSETWAYEPSTGRLAREYHQRRPDGTQEWVREMFIAPGEQIVYLRDRERAFHLVGPDIDTTRDRNLRRFPHLMLAEAMQSPQSLRSLGRFGPTIGVQAQTRQGEGLSLFFGRESDALNMVEYLEYLPTIGDSTVTWKFSDYRAVDGVGLVPWSYGVLVNHEWFTQMQVTGVSTDPDAVAAFLDLPERVPAPRRVELPANADASADARVERLAEGVWQVRSLRHGFHTMFIEFASHVMVVEAPTGYPLLNELPAGDAAPGTSENWLSERYRALVTETVPGKPIKYVVLSHFHNDHVGGLMAFGGESTTRVLVHEQDAEAVETMLRQAHTLCPDAGHDGGRFDIEPVGDRRVISDGTQRVELLDVSGNPHADHLLAVWLPGPRILYVADLLTAVNGHPAETHAPLNKAFMAWLRRSALEPDLILTSHGDGEPVGGGALPLASAP